VSTVIRPLEDADLEAVVALSLRAWAPVFASLSAALGPKAYGLMFPDWRAAQAAAVEATCTAPEHDVWVALADGRPVGFVALGLVDEDATRAGEIHMIAVDPAHQCSGIGAALMERAIAEIDAKGFGSVVVVEADGRLAGIVTDGDLRRNLLRTDLDGLPIEALMTGRPRTVSPETLLAKALEIQESMKITALIVVEAGRPVGLVHYHDLLRSGVA